MKIIRPTTVIDSTFSTNIAETDETEWTAGTRVVGDLRMVTTTANGASIATHRIYEANTTAGADPTLAANQGTGNGWDIIGATNAWKMIDDILQSKTVAASGNIVASFVPDAVTNSAALFGVNAESVNFTMTDPIDGEVYNQTYSMISDSGINDWYNYFYEPIVRQSTIAIFDLPAFPAATLTITVTDPTAASCGEAVIGTQFIIGDSQNGASFGIVDYSEKAVDPLTGNVTIKIGANKKISDIQVQIDTSRFTEIDRELRSVLNTPIVWVPTEEITGTIIYGYYNNFNTMISGPTRSTCFLQLEGLS
jgi:hypothetical protein